MNDTTMNNETGLKKISAFWVFILTIITLGYYPFFWFISRKDAVNSLSTTDKLKTSIINVLFWIFIWIPIVVQILNIFKLLDKNSLTGKLIMLSLGFIMFLMWLHIVFDYRRVLENYFNPKPRKEKVFGEVLTFLFNIIYLQYKINVFRQSKERWWEIKPVKPIDDKNCPVCGKSDLYYDIYSNLFCPNCKRVIEYKDYCA